MSAKPAARKGDPTADGDSNPIDSGSPDVLFDGLPAAREGDTTECGSELCDQLSSTVLINGKAAVMVDSEGTAGNVVMSGSGTVLIGDANTSIGLRNGHPINAPKVLQQIAEPMASTGSSSATPDDVEISYTISMKRGGNSILIPLDAPDFENLPPKLSKSSEKVTFTIINNKLAADSITLEVVSDADVIYTEADTTTFLQPGKHTWIWDGYDENGILNTADLKSAKIKIRLTATKDNQQKVFETPIQIKAKIDWLDARIDRGTLQSKRDPITANIIIRPSFSDGGTEGSSAEVAPTSFETLEGWAKEGIEHYWSRNGTRPNNIAPDIYTPKGKCLVTVQADLRSSPKAASFKLIDNLSEDFGRSTSLGGFRKIYHNLGYALRDAYPKDAMTNEYENFKETSAHEIGHLILNEYGGKKNYSWIHKGTSTLLQSEKPNNPTPKEGEIDLIHYFSEYTVTTTNRLSRTAASEQDVRSLLYLNQLHFSISKAKK